MLIYWNWNLRKRFKCHHYFSVIHSYFSDSTLLCLIIFLLTFLMFFCNLVTLSNCLNMLTGDDLLFTQCRYIVMHCKHLTITNVCHFYNSSLLTLNSFTNNMRNLFNQQFHWIALVKLPKHMCYHFGYSAGFLPETSQYFCIP